MLFCTCIIEKVSTANTSQLQFTLNNLLFLELDVPALELYQTSSVLGCNNLENVGMSFHCEVELKQTWHMFTIKRACEYILHSPYDQGVYQLAWGRPLLKLYLQAEFPILDEGKPRL